MTGRARDQAAARVIAEARIMVNVVTAYERIDFTLTDRAFDVDWPVPTLGVIPRRRIQRRWPLETIRSVRLVPVVFPSRFLVMVLLALVPIVFDLPLVADALMGLLAVLFLLLSIVAAVEVTADDETTTIPVCALQRHRVIEFLERVRSAAAAGSGS